MSDPADEAIRNWLSRFHDLATDRSGQRDVRMAAEWNEAHENQISWNRNRLPTARDEWFRTSSAIQRSVRTLQKDLQDRVAPTAQASRPEVVALLLGDGLQALSSLHSAVLRFGVTRRGSAGPQFKKQRLAVNRAVSKCCDFCRKANEILAKEVLATDAGDEERPGRIS